MPSVNTIPDIPQFGKSCSDKGGNEAGMSDWKECALGEVVTFQRGFDITQLEQSPGDYPVVSSSGIKSYHSECKAKGPGVVIGRKGTLVPSFT